MLNFMSWQINSFTGNLLFFFRQFKKNWIEFYSIFQLYANILKWILFESESFVTCFGITNYFNTKVMVFTVLSYLKDFVEMTHLRIHFQLWLMRVLGKKKTPRQKDCNLFFHIYYYCILFMLVYYYVYVPSSNLNYDCVILFCSSVHSRVCRLVCR